MRNLIFCLGVLCLFACLSFADATQIYKGDACDGYAVSISSTGTNTIIDSTDSVQANHTDYILKNGGSNPVWIDNVAAVATSGTGEGFKLEAGESLSIDGRCRDDVYGRTEAATSNTSTIYVFMTYLTR